MKQPLYSRNVMLGLLAMVVALPTACRKEESPTATTAPANAESKADAGEVEAVLAKADAYDGTEDKVVAKCAACALHMDGSVDNVLAAHGYTMRFCTPDCKHRFEEDLEGAVLALDIPEE